MQYLLATIIVMMVLLPLLGILSVLFMQDYISSNTFILCFVVLWVLGCIAIPAKAATFTYSNGRKVVAGSYREAARMCYLKETNGQYPGEKRGLEVIDMCANPKNTGSYKWVK